MKKTRETTQQVAEAVDNVTAIDALQLKAEFTQISSHLAHANEVYAEALRRHLKWRRKQDETYARLLVEKRETVEEKLPMDVLKAMVESDEEYDLVCSRAVDAEIEKVKAWGRCEALRAKKDALISLGAHVRAEVAGDPQLANYSRAQD